ncbi:MAG: slipin family protein [Candidatus Micrarchaeia archaeon]|jgi:regulator of protease activity HflC (stomatin/prohibitin superfamily)
MVFTIINQYEKGIRFKWGKFEKVLEPGFAWNIPFFHNIRTLDMRVKTIPIPPQEAMTKDNVPVKISAAVYYKVVDPFKVVMAIYDYNFAISQYAQTAVRDVVGNNELDLVLSDREKIAIEIEKLVDEETKEWGIDVSAIKLQDIELPEDMKRAMARQAEAEREKRATIILSDGELQSATNFADAARKLSSIKGALHLRTLQTLATNVSAEDSPTHLWLLPTQIMKFFENYGKK